MKRTSLFSRQKRSTSRKGRKRTPSSHTPDDYIVQVLNERSISDRDILITRQQYEDLKQCRKDWKNAQQVMDRQAQDMQRLGREKLEAVSAAERLQGVVETLEDRYRVDSQHMKELTLMNGKLTKELRDAQNQMIDQHHHSEQAVSKLKSSLGDIESVLEYRAAVGQRELGKCVKLLHQQVLETLDVSPYFSQKAQIIRLIQEAIGYIETVKRLLTANGRVAAAQEEETESQQLKDELRRLRESSISTTEYQAALEKMKDQTRMIKERLRSMEGEGAYKKVVEEYEGRVQLLTSEKEMLSEHVKTLQATLNEQCSVIEHLKGIIASLAGPYSPQKSEQHSQTAKVSPQRSPETHVESLMVSPEPTGQSKVSSAYTGLSKASARSEERDINFEIDALDRDIQLLQTSLQRALQQY